MPKSLYLYYFVVIVVSSIQLTHHLRIKPLCSCCFTFSKFIFEEIAPDERHQLPLNPRAFSGLEYIRKSSRRAIRAAPRRPLLAGSLKGKIRNWRLAYLGDHS